MIVKTKTRRGEEFFFNAIHINRNVTCPRHLDKKNMGESLLVSFGDYTGSDIVIEGPNKTRTLSTKYMPVRFDGTKFWHYNTPDLQGTKYSIVYYTKK